MIKHTNWNVNKKCTIHCQLCNANSKKNYAYAFLKKKKPTVKLSRRAHRIQMENI